MTVTETYVQTFEVQSNTQIEAIITGNNSYTGRMYDSRIEFALNNVDQNVEDLLSGSVVTRELFNNTFYIKVFHVYAGYVDSFNRPAQEFN